MTSEEWFLEDPKSFTIAREGISIDVPEGWDARIGLQWETDGSQAFPFLHAATMPLGGQRADYGGGVVERLGTQDVFVSLIQFGPAEAGSALFKVVDGLPMLEVRMFHRNQLQRRIRGQAGVQHFFTYQGRPFCLYVVLGSIANAPDLVERANSLLAGVTITPIGQSGS